MLSTTEKGRGGEDLAVRLLEQNGYRVVARNVRLPEGELDVVCLHGQTLVIVEVKRRATTSFGTALGAVDQRKRAKIRRLAADYAQIVAPLAQIRFDVVALDGNRATLHRNAF